VVTPALSLNAILFASHRLAGTIRDLVAASSRKPRRALMNAGADPCDRRPVDHRGEAEKAGYELGKRKPARPVTGRRMTEAEIKSVVDKLADIARVLSTSQRR